MKKIIVCGLALASLSAVALADTQLNFPATKLGGSTVADITADAEIRIDGVSMGRLAANMINTGGSPLQVKLIWHYDTAPEATWGLVFEELLVDADEDGLPDHQIRMYDVKVRSCDGQVYSRGLTSFYTYTAGVPFPTNLPAGMPSFSPNPCQPACEPGVVVAPPVLDFGTVEVMGAVTLPFTICNTSVGDCPNIVGTITENCDVFTVEPASYNLATGQCVTVNVTFNGTHAGLVSCPIVTTHGTVTAIVNDLVAANEAPAVFALGEAYPNPFNPSTTISYSVPENQEVTLNVFNTNGQLVKTLVNGTVERGEHKVVFDASNLASGVYVYTLKAGSETAMHKMVLVK